MVDGLKYNFCIYIFFSSHSKLQNVAFSNKLQKCNIPCLFYRKFGRCRGKDRGTCNKIHNPNQIIICPRYSQNEGYVLPISAIINVHFCSRFLQGACVNKTCLLSHNVSEEKMPTCKFFLDGMCTKEDCPYLHVKINAKADICQDFLQGFCRKAREVKYCYSLGTLQMFFYTYNF